MEPSGIGAVVAEGLIPVSDQQRKEKCGKQTSGQNRGKDEFTV